MGCSNGKMVKVSPAGVAEVTDSEHGNRNKMLKMKSSGKFGGSNASLNSSGDRPSGSATSKGSKHSHDSGFDANDYGDEEFDEYANIITENSDGALVQTIENGFQAPELDLCLNGIPAPRNLSAKDKARLDEQRILENLRNEGLIATSKSEAKNGLAFEVVAASTMPRRIPARLAKLDKKKKKKKTKEEIAEKLAKAEQRRKEAESERLEKINAITAKSDVAHVQEDQAKQQQELRETTIKKVDTVLEKREQKLQEVRDKLKAREEHAAKVRLRKKLHIPTQEELEQYEAMNIEQVGEPVVREQPLPVDNNQVQTTPEQNASEMQQS